MQHSENIADLMAALVAARKDFKAVHRNAANPFFKSKYPDLSEIVGATHEALMGQGLSVIQSPGSFADHNIYLTTMLAHISGQWMRDTFAMPIVKVDPQGVGAAVSYARRYSLQAFLNIAADLDDDAESAVEHEKAEIRKPQALNKPTTRVFDAPPNPNDSFGEEKAAFKAGLEMPANDPPKPKTGRVWNQKPNCISEPQAMRIFGIGKGRGKTNDWIREFLGSHGYTETNEIPKGEMYSKICSELEIA